MYDRLTDWLKCILTVEIPEEVTAFCFNLYEEGNDSWSMELIGADRFDVDDEDWRCDEVTDFGSRENLLGWQQACGWDEVLREIIVLLQRYLEEGEYRDKLMSRDGVGVGFVDGDVELLYTNERYQQ